MKKALLKEKGFSTVVLGFDLYKQTQKKQ